MPQDSTIFSTSALENIRYGRPDASDDEVIAAARAAFAHEFITALPVAADGTAFDFVSYARRPTGASEPA